MLDGREADTCRRGEGDGECMWESEGGEERGEGDGRGKGKGGIRYWTSYKVMVIHNCN